MTLIDLGEVSAETVAPVVPVNLPRARRAVLAVLTAVGLLVLGGSAPPAPSLVRTLWSATFRDTDTLSLDGGTAYLNRVSDESPPELTAYDLATGAVRWHARTGEVVSGYEPRPAGDVLLVPADPLLIKHTQGTEASYYSQVNRATVALDAATGAELWRSAGDAFPSAGIGEAVVTESNDDGAVTRLRLVRLRDGHELWNQPIPPSLEWTTLGTAGRPTEIATVTPAGDVTVLGYADGVVRHRGRLPWTGVFTASLSSAGPYLVVNRTGGAQTIATVYRPDDLRVLWRSDDLIGYVTACGTLICTVGADTVTGREAGTGREVWRATGVEDVQDIGGGRLLAGAAGPEATTIVLLDAATGRAIGDPAAGQAIVTIGPAAAAYLLRGTTSPPNRTAVTRLDLTDGRQMTLGLMEAIGEQGCRIVPGYLACPLDGRLTVTAAG